MRDGDPMRGLLVGLLLQGGVVCLLLALAREWTMLGGALIAMGLIEATFYALLRVRGRTVDHRVLYAGSWARA